MQNDSGAKEKKEVPFLPSWTYLTISVWVSLAFALIASISAIALIVRIKDISKQLNII
jgi:hypothetical protein